MNRKTTFITASLAVIILAIIAIIASTSAKSDKSDGQMWMRMNETLPLPQRIMPVRCHDNNHQEGAQDEGGIELTLDDNLNTIWHSQYYPTHEKVTPETPAELVYEFEDVDRIDRMVFVPRSDGSPNGIVTQAEVYVKTNGDGEERLMGRFEWPASPEPKTIVFEGGLQQPQSVRMLVLRGSGDFGSCSEMQFLRDENGPLASSLFADELYTTLKDGVTDEDIKREPVPVLRELASQLKNGTYRTDYRVATYECYDSPFYLAEQWKTARSYYDQLQGVTGIMIEPGKHLVMVSGIPDSMRVSLKVVSWFTGKKGRDFDGSNPEIHILSLQNGANVIYYESEWDGLAYITYFSEGYADKCPPVSVHFVGGTINGYLSPDKTNEQMHEMTASAPSRFIDVVSKKVHAVWTSEGMHKYCKSDDEKSPGYRQYMNVLDTLITWEQRVVGFEKYGRIPRNRTLLYVNYTYYMFCSSLGISAHVDEEERLLNCRTLIYGDHDAIWGISHEWGHQHQVDPYFCWGGLTEVSNNLNAYYNVMHMGYLYSQVRPDKRRGIEKAIRHYMEEENNDCIFEVSSIVDHAFERLAPILKLSNYFTNEGGMPDYLPDLYEALRYSEVESDSNNVVPYVLNFIRTASTVTGYNLLPYFKRFGFLRVKSFEINDYTKYYYQLTQEELDAFCKEMDSLTRKENLKVMPDGMIERIVKTPDIEYKRPYFAN